MNLSPTAWLATYGQLVRVRTRTNLFKHLVEISEYVEVSLDHFLELENDRRKLPLVNVACSFTDTAPDQLSAKVAQVLLNDVGVFWEPSSDGTMAVGLKGHVGSAMIVNGHQDIASIGTDVSHQN